MFDMLLVRKNLKSFGEDLAKVRNDIELVTREIENLAFAPLPTADVLALIEAWAKRNADEYRKHLRTVLVGISARPTIEPGEAWAHLSSSELLPEPSMHRPLSRDKQLCGLLGPDAVVELLRKQMEGLDLPAPGLSRAERPLAIAALEKKLTKLKAREAELLAEAEKAGLTVS